MIKIFLKAFIFLNIISPRTNAQSRDETVLVRGHRVESRSDRNTGQSVLVTPNDASRFDSLSYLKRESSVVAPETGRISPSGFTVPRIRGQDVKLTDVYLEDIHLQEPYSGLPLIEDLDLRAFGALEIHQGLPPPEVPGLNPIGVLRYRFRHLTKSDTKLGFQIGRPFGSSAWGLFQSITEEKETVHEKRRELRIYGRQHQTNGKYKYYSDEGTPYNSYDDALKIRDNNDQRSMQTVPYFRQQLKSYHLEGLAWIYRAERGLPVMSMLMPSVAREEAKGHLANLKIGKVQRNFVGFQEIKFNLGVTDSKDKRSLSDGSQNFLGAGSEGDLSVESRRGHVNAEMISGPGEVFLAYETGLTEVRDAIDNSLAVNLQRRSSAGSVAGRLYPLDKLTLELKGAWRQHFDRQQQSEAMVVLGGEAAKVRRLKSTDAFGASLGFSEEHWGLYIQQATAERLPSLIEEYGNGSNVRGNSQVKPEGIHHKEAGFFLKKDGSWRLGSAVYLDNIKDRIIFVPVMANAVKAQNIRETETMGLDLRAEAGLGGTHVYLSASRLLPYDLTGSERKVLPGIPERVLVGELEQKSEAATIRWLTRYRSEIFRDLANSVRLPAAWVHDFSFDYEVQWLDVSWQLGLSIKNVFNLMAVSIAAPDTPENTGKTAYSDTAGAPLPGRQWVMSIAATI